MLELVPTYKFSLLSMILPDGLAMLCEELYENCPIRMYEHLPRPRESGTHIGRWWCCCRRMYEHEFWADLDKFELMGFGVILGMDWLAKY